MLQLSQQLPTQPHTASALNNTRSLRLKPSGVCARSLQVCRSLKQHTRTTAPRSRAQRVVKATQQTDEQAATEVEHKLREAFEHAKEAEHDITAKRAEQEQDAEQRQKDQRFDRAKDAMNLKEAGHNLDPTAGHEQGDPDAHDSIEAKTHKNASPSKAVRQRLLELEAKRSLQPQQVSRPVNRRDPGPPMSHHYAAAAWWAVNVIALKGGKGQANFGYQ